jgi:hypothetical protein
MKGHLERDMNERCAVLTTLNGEIVEWRVFDTPAQAKQHYANGVGKLQEMLNHTDDDGVWEIMLCDVQQYALSHQKAEHLDTRESADWYSRYLQIMSQQARRMGGIRKGLSLTSWRKLRDGLKDVMDEEPSSAGGS